MEDEMEMDLEKVHKFLARGWCASADPGFVGECLSFWGFLANRDPERRRPPENPTREEVTTWASETLEESERFEGDIHPLAEFHPLAEWSLWFRWEGSFTLDRVVELTLTWDEDGPTSPTAILSWDSATGRPSRWLKIERVLRYPLEHWGMEDV